MIIKSNPITTTSGALGIFRYCTKNSKNEEITILNGEYIDVCECADDAFRWNRKNSLLHMQISSKEPLTNEQFLQMRERVRDEFNLSNNDIVCSAIHHHPRKENPDVDPRHLHLLIRMINPENGKPLDLSHKYQRQEKISRMFEIDNNFELVKGRHNKAVFENIPEKYKNKVKLLTKGELPNSFLINEQYQKSLRKGVNPFNIRNECKKILSLSDNFQSFYSAIIEKGYSLKQGKTKIILNDEKGRFVGSLDRILGMKKEEFSNFIGDFEIANNTIASPIHCQTSIDSQNIHKLVKVTPVEPQRKSSLSQKEPISSIKNIKNNSVFNGGSIGVVRSEKAQTTSNMTNEERQAIYDFNENEAKKDDDVRTLLSEQKKFNESLNKSFEKLVSKWSLNNYYLDRIYRNLVEKRAKQETIIDKKHPTLKTVKFDKIASCLHREYKKSLSKLSRQKREIWTICEEIKSWDDVGFFKGLRKKREVSHLKEKRNELFEEFKLNSLKLCNKILIRLGLMAEGQVSSVTYENSVYAKLFYDLTIKSCLERMAKAKERQIESKLWDWKRREAVESAREVLRKIDRLLNFDLKKLNEEELNNFKDKADSLEIDGCYDVLSAYNKREYGKAKQRDLGLIDELMGQEAIIEDIVCVTAYTPKEKAKSKGITYHL